MTLGRSLRRLVLCAALAFPFAVSCTITEEYDDSALKEQIEIIINKLYELEQKMNSEIQALKDMLAGKIMISSVSKDSQTGITTVTLSNGSTLELLPEKDLKSFVTYITLSDGVDYWAYIDENGKKQLFLDENGEAIPVMSDVPEVIVKDDETWIVIGGVEYPLGGNSVFSDYKLITDELTGEVYAVTFTFGDNMSFTVSVEGASGLWFVKPAGWSTVAISDYFVACGQTDRVQLDARGVVDYVLQIPDGWRVKEYEDIYMGAKYFDITAPSKELVESGVAAAEGDLKVVAVLKGGKATVAKLYLSTNPFKTFSVSLGKADVKMYNGLQKFVYGVCEESKYDEASILEVAEGLLEAYDYPKGYGLSDFDLVGKDLSEIAGKDLTAGEQYVFWAIPALYRSDNDDAGYYVQAGTFVNEFVTYASVKFEVGGESNNDAQLDMDLQGVDSYYVGLLPKADFMVEDIVYNLNNPGYYTAKTTPLTYRGSVFEFTGTKAEKATEYVAWFAVAEDGKTYVDADVVISEFETLDLLPGSDVNVTADNAVESPTDVQISVTAKGAESIYYVFMTASAAKNYTTEEARVTYLFANGAAAEGESVVAKASDVIEVKPDTEYVFMALATDTVGKYSKVITSDVKTKPIEYNALKVSLNVELNDPGNVVVSIAAEGAVDFLYWIGKTTDNVWKSASYLGGSAAKAQQYMYMNSGHDRFAKIKKYYPIVDGKITMDDLSSGVGYVIVAMAKDKDGLYSQAAELKFTPRSIALGNVVLSSDPKWSAVKPVIEWIPEAFEKPSAMMSGTYCFYYDCPDDMTAYVLCGTEAYIDDGGNIKDMTMDDRIIKIVELTDKPTDKDLLVDEELWDTTGSMDAWKWFRFAHGSALFGNAVVFAGSPGSHKDCKECDSYSGKNDVVIYYAADAPIEFRMPYAVGGDFDKVFVVYKDKNGDFYEPHVVDVPDEYYK